MLSPLDGMFIPFAKKKEEREKTGDPRFSLEERYPTHAEYLAHLTEAAKKLRDEGFLLDEDVTRIIERASAK
ncbi:MAG: alpha/beta hydrolase domain-containing protein [Prosthecobacter sp.]|nr:alpha/beta hydrolase domain-containing protein [Prosthecobacter sp.]